MGQAGAGKRQTLTAGAALLLDVFQRVLDRLALRLALVLLKLRLKLLLGLVGVEEKLLAGPEG